MTHWPTIWSGCDCTDRLWWRNKVWLISFKIVTWHGVLILFAGAWQKGGQDGDGIDGVDGHAASGRESVEPPDGDPSRRYSYVNPFISNMQRSERTAVGID
jgi:hypothetical protein